jgi:hypothetical protein
MLRRVLRAFIATSFPRLRRPATDGELVDRSAHTIGGSVTFISAVKRGEAITVFGRQASTGLGPLSTNGTTYVTAGVHSALTRFSRSETALLQ